MSMPPATPGTAMGWENRLAQTAFAVEALQSWLRFVPPKLASYPWLDVPVNVPPSPSPPEPAGPFQTFPAPAGAGL